MLLPGVEVEEAVRIAEGLREVCEARALVQQDRAAKFTISVGAGTELSAASSASHCSQRQSRPPRTSVRQAWMSAMARRCEGGIEAP